MCIILLSLGMLELCVSFSSSIFCIRSYISNNNNDIIIIIIFIYLTFPVFSCVPFLQLSILYFSLKLCVYLLLLMFFYLKKMFVDTVTISTVLIGTTRIVLQMSSINRYKCPLLAYIVSDR